MINTSFGNIKTCKRSDTVNERNFVRPETDLFRYTKEEEGTTLLKWDRNEEGPFDVALSDFII